MDTQIHKLDGNAKQALERGGALEVVLTLKTDGSIDIYHPESNPIALETDPTHLEGKQVKRANQMTFMLMNSGCVNINGQTYCW